MKMIKKAWYTISTTLWGIALAIVSLPEVIWNAMRLARAVIRNTNGLRNEFTKVYKATFRIVPWAFAVGALSLVAIVLLAIRGEWWLAVALWVAAGAFNLAVSWHLARQEGYWDLVMDFVILTMATLYPNDWESRQELKERGLA